MADKLPFEIRLANAIGRYEILFGEHPPTWGYREDELYSLLLKSLEDKVEMPRIDERIRDVLDIDDEANIIT